MNSLRHHLRAISPTLGILALVLAALIPAPALAQDLFSRSGESDLMLRDARRVKGLQVTVEVRFLTVQEEFLERVGVDFGGTVSGAAMKNNQPVEGAKIILEVYKVVTSDAGDSQAVTRTGRQTVQTGADGRFEVGLRELVNSDVRAEILAGEVASIRIEGTGKNGKRVDHLYLKGQATTGGLIP
jgi:hypothetical protein